MALPIDNGLTIQAYHAPMFTNNIRSVALLSKKHEVLLSDSYTGQNACFLMRKKRSKSWTTTHFEMGFTHYICLQQSRNPKTIQQEVEVQISGIER